jgi:plastocyanin
VDIEDYSGPPRGLLLALGIIGLVLGGALAGEFIFRLQPPLGGGGAAAAGTVLMPSGVGSNQALSFFPAKITVIIGQNNTVTFDNKDSSPHTVTADDGSFNSGNLNTGASWTHTFDAAGTFTYHCNYHSWMKGTIVVLASGTTST